VLVSYYLDNDLSALDRLEDLLDAYADARLAPKSAVLARIRANVLAQAAAAVATTAAANRLRLVESPASRPRWSLPPRFSRAVFGLGFAAALMLGTTAAVLAAPPGSAFYNARVFLETIALPTQADARLARHEELIQERLDEAMAAATRGDTTAMAAALVAYQSEVDAATAEIGSDPDRLAHLEEELAKHTVVLTSLAAQLPEQTSIEHAIDVSSSAITKLQGREQPTHPSHTPQPGGGNAGNGGAGNGEHQGGQNER
jgi:hypothetical protein